MQNEPEARTPRTEELGRSLPKGRRGFLAALTNLFLAGCTTLLGRAPRREATAIPAAPGITAVPGNESPVPRATTEAAPVEEPRPTNTLPPIEGAAAVVFVHPPVLTHLTENSAAICFELDQPADGIVTLVAGDRSTGISLPFAADRARQALVVNELSSGTSYTARIGVAAEAGGFAVPGFPVPGTDWGPLTFRTPDLAAPLRVGVLGDAGFGDSTTYALVEEMTARDFDFVIHTGDVVYQAYNNLSVHDAYVQKWYNPFKPLLTRLPIYAVPGNHDYDADVMAEDGFPYYARVFPGASDPAFPDPPSTYQGQFYAFERRGFQFLMLDSQTFFGVPGATGQEAWLAQRLSDGRYSHTVAVCHVPPYASGLHGNTDSWPVRRGWGTLFEAAGLPLVLSGHSHNYERLFVNGTTYIVSGGGSATLYGIELELDESQAFAATSHYVALTFEADSIELEAIALGGEVLDSTRIDLG